MRCGAMLVLLARVRVLVQLACMRVLVLLARVRVLMQLARVCGRWCSWRAC